MTLTPFNLDPQPENALLRRFDERAVRAARIGHQHKIVGRHKVRFLAEHMLNAVRVARFLVGHQNKTETEIRHDAVFLERCGQCAAARHGLLIIFHAAAINEIRIVFVVNDGPGIGTPKTFLSGGHDVQVAEYPQRPFGTPGNPNDKIGALLGRHSIVGGVHMFDVVDAEGTQPCLKIFGLVLFTVAAVVGAETATGRHGALQFKHAVGTAGERGKQSILFFLRHNDAPFKHLTPGTAERNPVKGKRKTAESRRPLCKRKRSLFFCGTSREDARADKPPSGLTTGKQGTA